MRLAAVFGGLFHAGVPTEAGPPPDPAPAAGSGDGKKSLEGKITLLWPVHFSSIPLSTASKSSLEAESFGAELAKIGLAGFKRYLEQTLPKEFELDEEFREIFREADHSRVNTGFLRWQKRVFADRAQVSTSTLTSRGELIPRLSGIDYTWPELYDNPTFKQLLSRIDQVSRLYLKRTGYTKEQLPKRFRIFTWVESFGRGDAMRPYARTDGAYLMGRYWPAAGRGSLKMNFEDPRGINPPYGKTYSHAIYDGNLALFPSWQPHFITPNMLNMTAVCFTFLVYPAEGNVLDWRDDLTGSLEVNRSVRVNLAP